MKPITYDELRAGWTHGHALTWFLRNVPERLENGSDPLVIPDYQRGHVWTDDQAARFIGFLAEGGTPQPIFVQRWPVMGGPMGGKPDELVDGLQRLTAICRFLDGAIPMELSDGRRAYLRDLPERDQRLLTGPSGPKLTVEVLELATREDVLRFYLKLNRGGTPHSEAEIERVRAMLPGA